MCFSPTHKKKKKKKPLLLIIHIIFTCQNLPSLKKIYLKSQLSTFHHKIYIYIYIFSPKNMEENVPNNSQVVSLAV